MLALALFDRGIADIFDSPFIIPVAGCLTGLGIVLGGVYAGVRNREMASRERLALIAAGQPIPPSLEELAIMHGVAKGPRRNDGRGARRAGIVLAFTALGLMAFFFALAAILHTPAVLCGAAVGLIPLLMGVGFLVDAHLNAKEAREAIPTPAEPGSPFVASR